AELAERAGGTGGAVAAPVAELVDDRDADRNEQRRQHNQEDHDREEHWISRILRGAESSVCLGELAAEFVDKNLGAAAQPDDVAERPSLDGVLSSGDKRRRFASVVPGNKRSS